MEKIQMSTETICYPMPCSLVGVNVRGKPNYLTVAWFSMVNVKPPYLMIALGKKTHYTNPGIKENGTFSVNIPSAPMADVTDYCGIVSGKKYNKATVFETFYGKLKTAPMIKECPYNVECKVIQTVDLPGNEALHRRDHRSTQRRALPYERAPRSAKDCSVHTLHAGAQISRIMDGSGSGVGDGQKAHPKRNLNFWNTLAPRYAAKSPFISLFQRVKTLLLPFEKGGQEGLKNVVSNS